MVGTVYRRSLPACGGYLCEGQVAGAGHHNHQPGHVTLHPYNHIKNIEVTLHILFIFWSQNDKFFEEDFKTLDEVPSKNLKLRLKSYSTIMKNISHNPRSSP